MNILTNEKNIVIAKGTIDYGIFDEPFEKWRVINDDITFYVLGDNCTVYEIADNITIPNDCEYKYCYTEKDGFYLNPDYVEPYDIETEVKRLTKENETLKTTLSNLENSTVEGEIETDFRLSMLELGLA